MKKKVLLINTSVTTYNGISSVILNYAKRTIGCVDYDMVIADGYNHEFVEKECGVFHQIIIPTASRTRQPITYMRYLIEIMGKKQYEVVHVHCNSATALVEIYAAKKAGIPIRLVHAHTSQGKYPLLHYLLRPLMCKMITQGLACSELAGKWMFPCDFSTIYNGIDIEKYKFDKTVREAYREELHLSNKFVIGHVGYMDTEKNHEFLIKAFSRIHTQNPDAVLMLIGDGRLRPTIEEQIASLGLNEHVMLLGSRSDVDKLYQCMDVFVLPSLWEGLPVSLVEAQTAGLQCFVSASVTKQVNVTGGIQYLGIGEENIDDWVGALLKAANLPKDRDAFGEIMRDSHFNVERAVGDLLRIYDHQRHQNSME